MSTTLTPNAGAGLYLVRRARTLAGPHQLRLVATAFLALLIVDLGRLTLARVGSGEPVGVGTTVVEAAVYVALALLLWRPAAGVLAAAVALVAAGLVGGTGTEPLLLALTGVTAFGRAGSTVRRGYAVGSVVYLGALLVVHPERLGFLAFWFGGAALLGAAVGETVRRLRRRRHRPHQEAATEVLEDARLRGDERRLLTRELHDVVTHQLSTVSLQVMGQQDGTDPEQLRKALSRIGTATDAALTELRLLVRVLRDDSATAAGVDEVAELTHRVGPTVAAAEWARRLTAAGFEPSIEVPARADRLGMTVQRTLTRALDVVGDNILRHATPRTPCSLSVTVNETQVVLRAANLAPDLPGRPAYGWGLRGLRERLDLTGGTFTAGPAAGGGSWVVVATVPHD